MPNTQRVLLMGEHPAELSRLADLLAQGDDPPAAGICLSTATAPLLSADTFALLIVCDAAAQRRLVLERWLCELPLGGPQPLLILRNGEPTTQLPTLRLDQLDAAALTAALAAASSQRQTLRDQLRAGISHALVRGEMELRYQPVLDMQRHRVDHVEVLLRWRHPLYGLIGPENFLDIAAASGAIHPLGIWTLRRACEQQRQWLAQGLPLIPLSINVADCQLDKPAFAAAVADCLPSSREQGGLGFEINAAALASCSAAGRGMLTRWHDDGIALTADNVGADQAAASLQGLPLDAMKFDRALIADCEQPDRAEALKSLLELGQSLGCDTIAAGVERRETARFLHRQRCDRLQGFCVARPLTGPEMGGWIRRIGAAAPPT